MMYLLLYVSAEMKKKPWERIARSKESMLTSPAMSPSEGTPETGKFEPEALKPLRTWSSTRYRNWLRAVRSPNRWLSYAVRLAFRSVLCSSFFSARPKSGVRFRVRL